MQDFSNSGWRNKSRQFSYIFENLQTPANESGSPMGYGVEQVEEPESYRVVQDFRTKKEISWDVY
jgi:hypothetical protein